MEKNKKLSKRELWLQNMKSAGQKTDSHHSKKDAKMPMHEYSENTRIFSPTSRGI